MMKSGSTPHWVTAGAVVQGATHVRQDKPCQDALLLWPASCEDSPLPPGCALACVADGHGSDRCPHSADGARLAVEVFAHMVAEILQATAESARAALKDETRLARQLEYQWKTAVRAFHTAQGRDTTEEESPAADSFPYELYGTTLLAVVATPQYLFALQIGDGDMLAVGPPTDAEAPAAVPLLPAAPPSLPRGGNETESLCLPDAWRFVRTAFLPYDTGSGAPMLLLSTDGYGNSFSSENGLLQAGADIYTLWRTHGRAYIADHLPQWLQETTQSGSGDDIALALLLWEP